MTRPRLSILLSIVLGCALAAPTAALAQKKKKAKPACGLSFLPFAVGAEWTYDFTVPDDPPEQPKGQVKVDFPQKLTIKVTDVQKVKGGLVEIHLEESYRKVTQKTVIKCDKETVQVDPASFFATGEPGGGVGMTIENFKRADNPSYIHKKGKLKKDQWREDVTFDVTRATSEGSDAKHQPSKVEVERAVTVVGRDGVNSVMSDHPRATKVEVIITGRASVEGKSVDMPQARALLWFDSNVGVVRAENRFGQGWTLSAFTWPTP